MRPQIVVRTYRWGFLAVLVAASLGGLVVWSVSNLSLPSVVDLPQTITESVHHHGLGKIGAFALIVLVVWECIGRIAGQLQGKPHQSENEKQERQDYSETKSALRAPITSFFRLGALEKLTAVLVIVGLLQWLTFEKTDETLQAQQRAWIQPFSLDLISGFSSGETLKYTFRFLNIGKEPATDVVMQGEPKGVDIPASGLLALWLSGENSWCEKTIPNKNGLVIWPGNNTKNISYVSSYPPDRIADILAGKAFLLIEGCVGYHTFGKPHFSAFCYFAVPGQVRPCMNHYFAN